MRDKVLTRSGGRCEAMVKIYDVYTRCGKVAFDVHHMLFRSRGGDVLDALDEDYHLVNLCREHHNWVHMNPAKAEAGGLVINGQMTDRYRGPDPYLRRRYG